MLDFSFWKDEATRAQAEVIRLARTVHYQRLALIVAGVAALGGWIGVALLLRLIARAAGV